MPLFDTRIEGKNLVGKFISATVLQVLSFVAENERANIKQRQAEDIRIAKEKGVKFGRPRAIIPNNTIEVLDDYINHKISNTKATKMLGISRGTFFRLPIKNKLNSNPVIFIFFIFLYLSIFYLLTIFFKLFSSIKTFNFIFNWIRFFI